MASSTDVGTEVETSLDLDSSSSDLPSIERRNYYLNKENAVGKKLKINDLFVETKDNGQCLLAQLNYDSFLYFASGLVNFYKDSCNIQYDVTALFGAPKALLIKKKYLTLRSCGYYLGILMKLKLSFCCKINIKKLVKSVK